MGLFGKLFGKDGTPPAPAQPDVPTLAIDINGEPLPDPDMTRRLEQLAAVPAEQRDTSWQYDFFTALWTAAIEIPSSTPFVGLDGFAYLRFDMPSADEFVAHNLAGLTQPCLDAGSGAVLFADARAEEPIYVIPMGMIESILRYRDWRGDPVDIAETRGAPDAGNVRLKAGSKVMQGTPSADYLSPEAARALDRHLKEIWKIEQPRVSVMMSAEMQPSRSLVVNVSRDAFGSDAHADNFARAVLWFLPPSRSIIFMPDTMAEADMIPLADLAKA
ncbi:hypothetical protein [Parasphingopyxis sp.]|uniref:hypothetical protein n=1 Tax=Parasphingopyxis sp. TaxID=1920299 RepID=UPI002631EC00|nr:hypothetical protein [Parasphingopyxis sp.]